MEYEERKLQAQKEFEDITESITSQLKSYEEKYGAEFALLKTDDELPTNICGYRLICLIDGSKL